MTTVAMRRVPPDLHTLTEHDHLPNARRLRVQVVTNSKGYLELNLNQRDLRLVPPETFQLSRVQVLRLAHNHIDYLPMMIAYLRALRVLDMTHNLLVQLPETLVNCRHLSQLTLTANRLTELPRSVGGLKALRGLALGENQFEHLPQEVGQLTSLRSLDVHSNKLWHLPFALEGLHNLLQLNLSDNMLDHVPLVITKIPSLQALNLSRNRLASLPVDFDRLKSLRELNLSHNKYVSLSSTLVTLRRLKYLSLASNNLKFLPSHMARLQNLRVLHLQDNGLRHVPCQLRRLKYYNVAANRLSNMSVEGMRSLVSLTASKNSLDTSPRGLHKLKQLKSLYLDNNVLVQLDEDIGRLSQLCVLDLSHNLLVSLPRAVYTLPRLQSFSVKGNYRLTKTGLQDRARTDSDPPDLRSKTPEGRRKGREGDDPNPAFIPLVNGGGGPREGGTGANKTPRGTTRRRGQMETGTHVTEEEGATHRNKQQPRYHQRTESDPKPPRAIIEDHSSHHQHQRRRNKSFSGRSIALPDTTGRGRGSEVNQLVVVPPHMNQSRMGTSADNGGKSRRFDLTMKSLRELLFGRSRKVKDTAKTIPVAPVTSALVGSGWDPNDTMRTAHSLHFPLQYHVDDIHREMRATPTPTLAPVPAHNDTGSGKGAWRTKEFMSGQDAASISRHNSEVSRASTPMKGDTRGRSGGGVGEFYYQARHGMTAGDAGRYAWENNTTGTHRAGNARYASSSGGLSWGSNTLPLNALAGNHTGRRGAMREGLHMAGTVPNYPNSNLGPQARPDSRNRWLGQWYGTSTDYDSSSMSRSGQHYGSERWGEEEGDGWPKHMTSARVHSGSSRGYGKFAPTRSRAPSGDFSVREARASFVTETPSWGGGGEEGGRGGRGRSGGGGKKGKSETAEWNGRGHVGYLPHNPGNHRPYRRQPNQLDASHRGNPMFSRSLRSYKSDSALHQVHDNDDNSIPRHYLSASLGRDSRNFRLHRSAYFYPPTGDDPLQQRASGDQPYPQYDVENDSLDQASDSDDFDDFDNEDSDDDESDRGSRGSEGGQDGGRFYPRQQLGGYTSLRSPHRHWSLTQHPTSSEGGANISGSLRHRGVRPVSVKGSFAHQHHPAVNKGSRANVSTSQDLSFFQFDHVLKTEDLQVKPTSSSLPSVSHMSHSAGAGTISVGYGNPDDDNNNNTVFSKDTTGPLEIVRSRSIDSLMDQVASSSRHPISTRHASAARGGYFGPRQEGSELSTTRTGGTRRWEERRHSTGAGLVVEGSGGNHGEDNARTDYSLLGVCSQIETMLNKNVLRPSTRGHSKGGRHKFPEKTTQRKTNALRSRTHSDGGDGGQWQNRATMTTMDHDYAQGDHHDVAHSDNEEEEEEEEEAQPGSRPDLEYGQPQTFTVTSAGGQFASKEGPEILVNVPAHGVRRALHITVQLLHLSPRLVTQVKQYNRFVANLVSVGPLVYFHTAGDSALNSPATLTLPAPPSDKRGHLVVLTVRKDNSCIPCSSAYRSAKMAVTLSAWHFNAKIVVITRAKCKYKACKSVEQLLQSVGATQT